MSFLYVLPFFICHNLHVAAFFFHLFLYASLLMSCCIIQYSKESDLSFCVIFYQEDDFLSYFRY